MSKRKRNEPTGMEGLRSEYVELIARAGVVPGEELTSQHEAALVGALVLEADWTREGAIELVTLVKKYGHFFLRNATSLAAAMNVEDGLLGH